MEDKHIMLVDDDKMVVSALSSYLTGHGFRVSGCYGGKQLFDELEKERPDLIILDINMPGMDGFEVCGKMRNTGRFADIPVIILSGKGELDAKVSGLDLGADDYIVKPFAPDELRSRINAVLRRSEKSEQPDILDIDGVIEIDRRKYEVRVNGQNADLTRTEFKILELLSSRRGQVFPRERILQYLWGEEKVVVERTIDVHIRHLREKLGEAGDIITNVRGVGYKLRDGSEEE